MPRFEKGSPEAKEWAAKMREKRNQKPTPSQEISNDLDVNALLKRIEELESRNFFVQPQAPASTTRTVLTKYSINPRDYPDPRERIAHEERLQRFAFPLNYELNWEIKRVNYEEDGQKYVAPRFHLDLIGKVVDDETGEMTNQRYIAKRGIFLEDPDAYVMVAQQHGIEVPESLVVEFLNEMRYMTMRDWVLEYFYPPLPTSNKKNKKEQVIGNTLVEVYEVSSTESQTIPFNQLSKKL